MKNNQVDINNEDVCILGDLHFGVHQDSIAWLNIADKFIDWLDKQLRKHKITDIIIPGDIFHDRNEIGVLTLNSAAKIFSKLKRYNIIMIPGNHDSFYRDKSDINSISIFNGWSNITVLEEITTINAFDKKITFCPWGTTVSQIPKSDIIFGHFEISSFKMNSYKICTEGIDTKEILNKGDLIITGHFHLKEERKYKKGTIFYIGTPYQMDFGDIDITKGIHLFNFKTNNFKFIENNISPKHHKLRLSELIELGSITDNIKKIIPNNFIKLIIDLNVEIDRIDLLIKKISSLNPLNLIVEYDIISKYNTDNVNNMNVDNNINITSVIEEFIDLLELKENKNDVMDYTLDLYKRTLNNE